MSNDTWRGLWFRDERLWGNPNSTFAVAAYNYYLEGMTNIAYAFHFGYNEMQNMDIKEFEFFLQRAIEVLEKDNK